MATVRPDMDMDMDMHMAVGLLSLRERQQTHLLN